MHRWCAPEREGPAAESIGQGKDEVLPSYRRTPIDLAEEDEIAARAAWLHYSGGMTQSDVAKRFGIPTTRAHRLIARAAKAGLVRVFVDAEVVGCVALEDMLAARYGLAMCRIAPDLAEPGPLPLRALGLVGADWLMRTLEARSHATIGIGHGRTLASVVAMLPAFPCTTTRFVSILGGLTRKFAANPYDVIHKLAEKTGAEAYLMPAPLFANSLEDRRVMMQQSGLAATMRLIDEASLVIVGVGAVDAAGSLSSANALETDAALEELRAMGACAELLGQFFDEDGAILSTPFDGRVMAPDLETLRGREVVAIAGGPDKARALDAALKGGIVTGLITDEATARGLADMAAAPAGLPLISNMASG